VDFATVDVPPQPAVNQPPAQTPEQAAEAARELEAQRVAAAAAAETARLAEEGARKLSKIFGAMQAQDAAAVLQEMEDREIEQILQHMSDRLAAQILPAPARSGSFRRARRWWQGPRRALRPGLPIQARGRGSPAPAVRV
jgi:hypothetical protein